MTDEHEIDADHRLDERLRELGEQALPDEFDDRAQLLDFARMLQTFTQPGAGGSAVLTPDCPVCGQPPQLRASARQAFCGNDDCDALMWDPTADAAEQLANRRSVRLLRGDDEDGAR